jgi:hypothetical protein
LGVPIFSGNIAKDDLLDNLLNGKTNKKRPAVPGPSTYAALKFFIKTPRALLVDYAGCSIRPEKTYSRIQPR